MRRHLRRAVGVGAATLVIMTTDGVGLAQGVPGQQSGPEIAAISVTSDGNTVTIRSEDLAVAPPWAGGSCTVGKKRAATQAARCGIGTPTG
jgi:hypothetical protein